MGSDIEELGEWIAEQAAHLDAATHRLLTAVREFDAAHGWHKQGARTCAEWLSWRVGWSTNTARDRVRVAQRLGELPLVDEALRRGELSYCKVRAITRVATPANEAALVEMARVSTGAQLDQLCRKYAAVKRQGEVADPRNDADERYLTRRDLDNGFVEIRARLHPEEAAAIWAALDQIVTERFQRANAHAPASPPDAGSEVLSAEALSGLSEETAPQIDDLHESRGDLTAYLAWMRAGAEDVSAETPDEPGATTSDHSSAASRAAGATRGDQAHFGRIDALVDLAQQVLRGDKPNRSPIELIVTVSEDVLRDPATAADPIGCLSDGTCVSAETVRRLSCDCGVVEMTENHEGRPMTVGRKTRSISASLKRALMRRDQHCRFPGCQNRLFVDGHHAKHWAAGGETSLRNLVSLCGYHHRFVHEYGYRVELDAEQTPHFFDDRGRPVVDVPALPSNDRRGWPTISGQNRALEISAGTPACGWDGEPVDYDCVMDALVSVDRQPKRSDDDLTN